MIQVLSNCGDAALISFYIYTFTTVFPRGIPVAPPFHRASRLTHHVAADNTNPRNTHDEGEDVVLLVLRPGAVWHGEAEPDQERQAEDEEKTFHPPLGPCQKVFALLSATQQKYGTIFCGRKRSDAIQLLLGVGQ